MHYSLSSETADRVILTRGGNPPGPPGQHRATTTKVLLFSPPLLSSSSLLLFSPPLLSSSSLLLFSPPLLSSPSLSPFFPPSPRGYCGNPNRVTCWRLRPKAGVNPTPVDRRPIPFAQLSTVSRRTCGRNNRNGRLKP